MKTKEFLEFYENNNCEVIDKITQFDVKKSNGTIILFHKIFIPELTIKDLEESIKSN